MNNDQRNWRWLAWSGCLLLAMVVAFVGTRVVRTRSLKASGAYQTAIQWAVGSDQVSKAVGVPLFTGTFVSGTVHESGSSGDANLAIPVAGSKGAGTIYVTGSKKGGVWIFSKLELLMDETHETIDLLSAKAGSVQSASDPR